MVIVIKRAVFSRTSTRASDLFAVRPSAGAGRPLMSSRGRPVRFDFFDDAATTAGGGLHFWFLLPLGCQRRRRAGLTNSIVSNAHDVSS